MPTLPPNTRPLDGQHNASIVSQAGGVTLTPDQLDQDFKAQLSQLGSYFNENQAGYENRRRQLFQNPTDLRIISSEGVDLLFTPTFGFNSVSKYTPVFRYMPPRTNDSVRPFKEGIKFIVMHSFGRGYDYAITSKTKNKTVPIEQATGHNPARFALGVRTLVDPKGNNITNIHHVNSLRGDLINSVSWDNRCVHGEGGGITGINDYSIGIEHEEWYVKFLSEGKRPREIEDHGPYSEHQYLIDAFIIKKLEAYTGETYTRYLGHGAELKQNIKSKVTGCFNHASSSKHADPGAEFFLPPGFLLNVTPISTAPMAADRPASWERRFEIWYSDIARGTKISAYDRIFDKVARLRSFDLQTEVFDASLRGSRIPITVPEVSGDYVVAAAQKATQDRLSAVSRAQVMQAKSRSSMYSAAEQFNNTAAVTWAKSTAALVKISQNVSDVPVVVNAVRLDSNTGMWVTVNSTNVTPSTSATVDNTTSTPELNAKV